MSEWVRCNSCCCKPGQRRFYLTNCGHLFCEECMKESPETCKLCKNPCKSIMLTSQMKPEVEEYFTDIPTLLSRQQKKLLQVYEFQRTHWKSFVALYDKQEASMQNVQKDLQRLVELEREVALLREENNHLRRLLSESKQHHTPGKTTNPSPGVSLRRGHSSGHSSSPYSNSPYGMNVTSTPQQDYQQQRGCQSQIPRTPAGPSRLTVRTPPSNGMIGTTRRSPYHHGSQRPGSAGTTPGTIIRTANTPGSQEPVTPSMLRASIPQNNFSPMNVNSPMMSSQSRVVGSWMSSQNHLPMSQQHTPGSSITNSLRGYLQADTSPASQPHCTPSQNKETHSSQLDPTRRQIQLRYQPRTNSLAMPPYITTPGSST